MLALRLELSGTRSSRDSRPILRHIHPLPVPKIRLQRIYRRIRNCVSKRIPHRGSSDHSTRVARSSLFFPSHDLRSALNTISNCAGWLARTVRGAAARHEYDLASRTRQRAYSALRRKPTVWTQRSRLSLVVQGSMPRTLGPDTAPISWPCFRRDLFLPEFQLQFLRAPPAAKNLPHEK